MSYLLCYFFFFFKQKTAYEMRISDWSSDVCSSDLARREWRALRARHCPWLRRQRYDNPLTHSSVQNSIETLVRLSSGNGRSACGRTAHPPRACPRRYCGERAARSEEHTSELQSLMPISYAVFCLKKKTNYKTI